MSNILSLQQLEAETALVEEKASSASIFCVGSNASSMSIICTDTD